MPMSVTMPMDSAKSIANSLHERATELWGSERARVLRPLIEQTANRIWRISQDPPPPDEEPGFYF